MTRLRTLLLTLLVAWPTLVVAQPADEIRYVHTDAIGSVRMLTDEAGAVVVRHDYLPFGQEAPEPTTDNARRFAGKERDAETGWDYFGARYYASNMGRFTTVDPYLDVQKALVDPQQWNRYAYARDNPLRYVDPDGRAIETLWDLANLALGAKSAYDNFRSGNILSGVLDSGGAVLDLAAAIVPGVPGGVGTAIKAARAVDRIDEAADAAQDSRAVIGRVKDLRDLGAGERSLLSRLPDQGSSKANWYQNAGVLRQEIRRGLPIRDASPGDRSGQFLNAERSLLRDRGWTFNPKTNLWMPPEP